MYHASLQNLHDINVNTRSTCHFLLYPGWVFKDISRGECWKCHFRASGCKKFLGEDVLRPPTNMPLWRSFLSPPSLKCAPPSLKGPFIIIWSTTLWLQSFSVLYLSLIFNIHVHFLYKFQYNKARYSRSSIHHDQHTCLFWSVYGVFLGLFGLCPCIMVKRIGQNIS